MKILLWLDDVRDPNVFQHNINPDLYDDIVWVTSYDEFVNWIMDNGLPSLVSFDHDLGLVDYITRIESGQSKRSSRKLKKLNISGYGCTEWLIEYCKENGYEFPLYYVHSMNPVGKEKIINRIESFKQYDE